MAMDIEKLNGRVVRAAFFLVPSALILAGCLNFLFYVAGAFKPAVAVPYIALHLLFVLSLGSVFGNAAIEAALALSEERSALRKTLYGGRSFFPVRNAVFIVIFVALYIVMTRLVPYIGSIRMLMLAVPSLAIFFNAPRFISGRVRLIDGGYVFYRGRFQSVFSWGTDENSRLVFIAGDGRTLSTDLEAAGKDFDELKAEFEKNGLKGVKGK